MDGTRRAAPVPPRKGGRVPLPSGARDHITERLGLEWSSVEHGAADVRGVPRTVVEHFSRRRAQIVEHMGERGVSSPAAAQVVALETRRAKQHVAVDRLRAEWRARAAEHGLTGDAVERVVRGRSSHRRPALTGELLTRLTAQASSFGRPELLQALADAHPDGGRVVQLEALADRILAAPAIVRLADGRAQAGVTEARYTTRELLRIEEAFVRGAWSSSADGRSATACPRRGEAHPRSRCASTTDRRARP